MGKTKTEDTGGNEPVEVTWDTEPLDVSLERHGNKKPDRKVKVRGILRDDWLEREAAVAPGTVHRIVEAVAKALRHGYEPRMDESIRFVHMVDAEFAHMRVSVQPMGSFRNCLEETAFRLRYEGHDVSPEEAEGLRDGPPSPEGDVADGEEQDEVSPDPMVTCPGCHKRFRVHKKNK